MSNFLTKIVESMGSMYDSAANAVFNAPFAVIGAGIGLYGGATRKPKTIGKGALVSLIHPFGKALFEGNTYSNGDFSQDTLKGLAAVGIASAIGYGASLLFTPKGVRERANYGLNMKFEKQVKKGLKNKDLTALVAAETTDPKVKSIIRRP